LKKDLERIAAAKEAIGEDVPLMVDADHCYNVPTAIALRRELEKMNIYWFEEPISPEVIDGYIEVTRTLDIPTGPGLGIDINYASIEKYRAGEMDGFAWEPFKDRQA